MTGRRALPAKLVGTVWDTPEGREHYARVTADRSSNPVAAAQMYAVARTLRWCAVHLQEVAQSEVLTVQEAVRWADYYTEAAGQIETLDLDDDGRPDDGGCCVVCQEVVCDDDCPLAEVRA